MTCQELATAVQYGANVIVVVVNNGSYGSIRMHQDKHYPGRRYGTDLVNPDMVALARAYAPAPRGSSAPSSSPKPSSRPWRPTARSSSKC